jgi:hypothetical protein
MLKCDDFGFEKINHWDKKLQNEITSKRSWMRASTAEKTLPLTVVTSTYEAWTKTTMPSARKLTYAVM